MFGIRFAKFAPSEYVIQFKNNTIIREGAGLSFFYYAPTSSIVKVPINSFDVPFAFTDISSDFQPITLQGQLTYQITDPAKLVKSMDFGIQANGAYATRDPEQLPERLILATQVAIRADLSQLTMKEALVSSTEICEKVRRRMETSPILGSLGLSLLDLSLVSIKTSPEMTKALESETREALHKRADDAIYERRNASVEQERRIRENELNTEISVEEKQKTIRERKIAADIAIEVERRELIETRVANEQKLADSKAYALDATMRPLKGADWRTVLAVMGGGQLDPNVLMAMAFKEMAENAGKIGELNVNPDFLKTMIRRESK